MSARGVAGRGAVGRAEISHDITHAPSPFPSHPRHLVSDSRMKFLDQRRRRGSPLRRGLEQLRSRGARSATAVTPTQTVP